MIPFARVFLNAEQSQDVVNQVNQEIKNGRNNNKGVREYFDRANELARYIQSEDNAIFSRDKSLQNTQRDDTLDSNLRRKGRYYDSPRLYVKAKRADRFGLLDDNVYRQGDGIFSDDEVSFANDPATRIYGQSIRTKKQREEFAQRERRRMVDNVKNLADKLHLDNVEIVTDVNTLEPSDEQRNDIRRSIKDNPNIINAITALLRVFGTVDIGNILQSAKTNTTIQDDGMVSRGSGKGSSNGTTRNRRNGSHYERRVGKVSPDENDDEELSFRQGDGIFTDDEVSFANDPASRIYGQSIRTKKQREEFIKTMLHEAVALNLC